MAELWPWVLDDTHDRDSKRNQTRVWTYSDRTHRFPLECLSKPESIAQPCSKSRVNGLLARLKCPWAGIRIHRSSRKAVLEPTWPLTSGCRWQRKDIFNEGSGWAQKDSRGGGNLWVIRIPKKKSGLTSRIALKPAGFAALQRFRWDVHFLGSGVKRGHSALITTESHRNKGTETTSIHLILPTTWLPAGTSQSLWPNWK